MPQTTPLLLKGRIAIITGASAGIGRQLAIDFAAQGAKVVLNARREPLLAELTAELGRDQAIAVPGDAADESVINRLFDTARDAFGGPAKREADLVICNAGRGLRGSVHDSDTAQWEEVIRTNLLGASRLLRIAADRLAGPIPVQVGAPAQSPPPPQPPANWLDKPRDIIILGSSVGRHISPFSSMYGSTKAAVHMLAESLRRLLAPKGVRVSLLEPGIVRSEFQDAAGYDRATFGKFMDSIAPVLEPTDISRLALFMASQPAGVCINDVMIRPTRQEYP